MAKKRGLSEGRPKPLRAQRNQAKPEEGVGLEIPRASKWAKIGPGGRIVIPSSMRKALGINEGDQVVLRLHDYELRILPKDVALRRVQDFVSKHASKDKRSWVDLLIEERRREVEREGKGE
jgi:AbrB family looped-hinge helix DNA binding protein